MTRRSEIGRAEAFRLYTETRSIKGVFARLKADGRAIGRATLNRWADEDRWSERLAETDPTGLQAQTAMVRYEADLSDGERVSSTLGTLCGMTAAIGAVVTKRLSETKFDTLEISDVIALAKAGADLAKVLDSIQRAAAAPQQMVDVTPGQPTAIPGLDLNKAIEQLDYRR